MARSFNGSTDQILSGSTSPGTAIATIACWVKLTSLANAYTAVYLMNGNSTNFYSLFFKSTGHAAYYVITAATTRGLDPGTGAIVTGGWHHFGLSYSVTNGLQAYLDGVPDGTVAPAGMAGPGSAKQAAVGYDPNNANRQTTGSIADCAFWNVELTAGEWSALAQGATPPMVRAQNLIGWWPLNGLESPEPDLSGNHNNGTLTGTTLAAGPPLMLFTPRWPQFSEVPPPLFYTIRKQVRLNILQTGP